ncbi:MAG: endonuclease III [Leptospiraceae bacterium]|nr:endonuclease III [Leptospiraceae bacterium]MCP5511968.1 endonuclease III [Leptospiraceae bacterium]
MNSGKISSFTNKIYKILEAEYGKVSCPLHYKKPHELAIAVILSAQCTDERVNLTTPELFKRYPTLEDFANASPEDLEKLIFSTGFYKNKTKSILGFSKKLLNEYRGKLPESIQELIEFPGIGRKTANVLLNELYNKSEGIVVDTHVKRISKLLGLTVSQDPIQIERDLMSKFHQDQWLNISLYFIFLGRSTCSARNRQCSICILKKICPSNQELLQS